MPASPEQNQRWYAVQTRYRCEQTVTAGLCGKGLETFLPLVTQTHRWSDRNKKIEVPVFSGYTFTRFDNTARLRKQLLQTTGVIGLVSFSNEASPVPDKQIDDLRTVLAQKVPCALHAFLSLGQKVRIRGGSLDGIEGILTQNGERNLIISIAAVGRSIAIKIAGYELEPL